MDSDAVGAHPFRQQRKRHGIGLNHLAAITRKLAVARLAQCGSVVDVQAEQEGFLAHGKDLNVQPPTFNIQHPMTNDE
jgi:hypothetical protein